MADHPAAALILDRKDPGPWHVVLGEFGSHAAFVAHQLKAELIELDRLDDLGLADLKLKHGKTPFVVYLERETACTLGSDAKMSYWASKPIKKRSSSIRALVRAAVQVLGRMEDPEQPVLDGVGDRLVDLLGEGAAPEAYLWGAVWDLTDPKLGDMVSSTWVSVWEKPWAWTAGSKVPLARRLHGLYRDLVGWVFVRADDMVAAKAFGLSPSKVAWLKTLRLDTVKVDQSIMVLSAWRGTQGGPEADYRAGMKLSAIWARHGHA